MLYFDHSAAAVFVLHTFGADEEAIPRNKILYSLGAAGGDGALRYLRYNCSALEVIDLNVPL